MNKNILVNNKDKSSWRMDAALRYIYINEIIFVTLAVLCFVGELLAEVTDRVSFFYWVLMTPVFFFSSMISERAKTLSTGLETEHLVRYELFYWGSAFLAVLLIFSMWHAEIIHPLAGSLMIHIVLAHTMFLTGIVLGVRFYLLGLFLFLTAALSITEIGTFGVDLVMLLPIISLGFYIEDQYIFPVLKRKHDFITDVDRGSKTERKKI